VRESRTQGSVRGAASNDRPYRVWFPLYSTKKAAGELELLRPV